MTYHVDFDIEFKKNPYKGFYVAIEGIDGSGKTTQTKEIVKELKHLGKEAVLVREPRKKGVIGDIIQEVLTGKLKMPSLALQYLFSTDRVLNQEEVIIPSLSKGKMIISDRCFWSAVVYGILDRTSGKYDYKDANFMLIVHSVLSMYHQFIVPDYTFYLKIGLKTALARIAEKKDKKEIYEDREKLEKVINGYDWLSKKFAKEIITIDGEESVEKVTEDIVGRIKNHE